MYGFHNMWRGKNGEHMFPASYVPSFNVLLPHINPPSLHGKTLYWVKIIVF